MVLVSLLAVVGLLLCIYLLYLEHTLSYRVDYKPFCDISDKISCTKSLQSAYAKTFGVSNALLGLTYYTFMLLLSLCSCFKILLSVALFGCAVSVYFAYILYTKIHALCLICVSTYVINFALVLAIYFGR